ncbi:hypothetical protein OH492_27855 [Vibrio chagasii]|nr:hypothetical protein [Vibrio chagasii]
MLSSQNKKRPFPIRVTGQTVLDNTAVVFTEHSIEIRFRINLPADES